MTVIDGGFSSLDAPRGTGGPKSNYGIQFVGPHLTLFFHPPGVVCAILGVDVEASRHVYEAAGYSDCVVAALLQTLKETPARKLHRFG